MAANSGIEWTDHTANFWWGCFKISPGCQHCYAHTWAQRYGKNIWGPARTTGRELKKGVWKELPKWNRKAEQEGRRRRVFVQSMADFYEDHPQVTPWREQAMDLMEQLTWLDFQVLTKRPENIAGMSARWMKDWPAHIWIGTSVEDQQRADERIPHLLKIPARVRFLSCEPLLGSIQLDDGHSSWLTCNGPRPGESECCESQYVCGECFHGIDWVITGGESGHNARPMHIQWARNLRDQCQAAGVPYFHKQNGEFISRPEAELIPSLTNWRDEIHYTWWGCLALDGEFWPETSNWNGRQAEPPDWEVTVYKVGKKAAGRLLDGREWNEVPELVGSAL